MPTMPEKTVTDIKTLGAQNVVMAAINDTPMLRDNMPRAALDTNNIRKIGDFIMSQDVYSNAFLSALMNRIARVIITSRLYENPWRMFKKGLLEYGEIVEELFVQMAKPHDYDPELAVTNQFKREIPDVRSAFHVMNYQKFYKETISNDQLRQAFLGWEGITDLIGRIIDAMYTGANYDEFVSMKYMIARMALDGYMYPISLPNVTADNAKSIVTTIKGLSNQLEFMSTKYNYAGVSTYTDKSSQYLIINAQFDATIDVEVLASAFNMDKAEFMGNRVLVDSFAAQDTERLEMLFGNSAWYTPFTQAELTALENMLGVLVDRDWFMIFDNYYNMTEKYNGEGLYWNYWYHAWKTFSASPFQTATVLAVGEQTITGITVNPATLTLAPGARYQFSTTVAGSPFVDRAVLWSITGNASEQTTINSQGLLIVASNETASSITVNATSRYDTTKSAQSVVTIASASV